MSASFGRDGHSRVFMKEAFSAYPSRARRMEAIMLRVNVVFILTN